MLKDEGELLRATCISLEQFMSVYYCIKYPGYFSCLIGILDEIRTQAEEIRCDHGRKFHNNAKVLN